MGAKYPTILRGPDKTLVTLPCSVVSIAFCISIAAGLRRRITAMPAQICQDKRKRVVGAQQVLHKLLRRPILL